MDLNKIPQKDDEFLLEDFDDEILLYHPGKTVSFYLNSQAAIIWDLCDGESSIREIIDALIENYPDAKDQMENDVVSSLETFVKNGAILLK